MTMMMMMVVEMSIYLYCCLLVVERFIMSLLRKLISRKDISGDARVRWQAGSTDNIENHSVPDVHRDTVETMSRSKSADDVTDAIVAQPATYLSDCDRTQRSAANIQPSQQSAVSSSNDEVLAEIPAAENQVVLSAGDVTAVIEVVAELETHVTHDEQPQVSSSTSSSTSAAAAAQTVSVSSIVSLHLHVSIKFAL